MTRRGDAWTADFAFAQSSPVWAFTHSAVTRVEGTPWRPRSWRVLTPGVRLERRGGYDVLVAARGAVPRRVRVGFTPFPGDLRADYDPALVFTDGAVALYSSQFDAFPLPSPAAAERVPTDLSDSSLDADPALVTYRDAAGPVLHAGRRSASLRLRATETYILFGASATLETPDLSAIIDPALPAWLRGELLASTPRTLDLLSDRLGPRKGTKPTLMVSWAGPTLRLSSMGGSTLPGLILMTFEGEGVARTNPAALDDARWFIAHEAAHFWLGQTISYVRERDAWITEGGSDLLASRTVAALNGRYDPLPRLQALVDECVALATNKPVGGAAARGENRAFYACGATFALAAEGAARKRRGDAFSFHRGLIAANRADGFVSEAEWLAALTRVSRDPRVAGDVRRLIDTAVAAPAPLIASIFARAGVSHDLRGGRVVLR